MKRPNALYIIMCAVAAMPFVCSCDDTVYNDGEGVVPSLTARYIFSDTESVYFAATSPAPASMNVETMNTPWQLSGMADWLRVTPASGTESAGVRLEADDNMQAGYRLSVFALTSTDPTYNFNQLVYATQDGQEPFFSVPESELSFGFKGGTQTVDVQTNYKDLSVESAADWISATADGQRVTVTVQANGTDAMRTGSVCITARFLDPETDETLTEETAILTVTQSGPEVTASANVLEFYNNAETKTVSIRSDAAWTATTGQQWISVSPTSGAAGEAVLSVSVTDNGGTEERRGAVYVTAGADTRIEIPVVQKGLYIEIADREYELPSTATSVKTTVNTCLSLWSVLECPNWITVTPDKGGSGVTTLTLAAADNPNTTVRSGRVVVGNASLALADTIRVSQKGKTFDGLVATLTFENKASSQTIDITTDGHWTATSSAPWLTVSPAAGDGNGQLTVSVTENTDDDSRMGTISVTVGGTTRTVSVTQRGRYFTIDRGSSAAIASTGGTITLDISTNQTWTAAVLHDAKWLTLSATSGTGSASIGITVTDNPSVNERTDTVVFTPAGTQAIRLVVRQSGRYLTVSTATVAFFYDGGTSEPVTVSTDGTWRTEKSAGASWLTVTTTGSTLTFSADKNTGSDIRTATVTLLLTGLTDSETEARMAEITVTQYSKDTQFLRTDYDEDQRIDIIYKDGATVVRTEYGPDKVIN